MDAQFSISWDAQKSFLSGLIRFQQSVTEMALFFHGSPPKISKGDYVDMTLAADGHYVRVHQVVLALSSPYFGELIKSAQTRNNIHPILFLNGISYKTLTYLLEYMYTGEVCISIDNLVDFIEAGKKLLIKGIEKLENPLLTVQKRSETQNSDAQEYNIIQVCNQPNEDLDDDSKQQNSDGTVTRNMEVDKDITIVPIESDYILPDRTTSSPKPVKILPKPTSVAQKVIVGKSEDIKGPIQGELQYTISNKGSLQVILNRFVYYAKYTKKSRLRQWRCVDYLNYSLKCPAFILTKEDAILQRVSAHNHPFHDQKIMKKMRAGRVYTTIKEVENQQEIEDLYIKSGGSLSLHSQSPRKSI